MPLEKRIIKSQLAEKATFAYQPRSLEQRISSSAEEFVREEAEQPNDFKISDLIANQVGISKLEDEAQQDKINAQLMERLKVAQEQAYKEGHELGRIEGADQAFQETKAQLAEKLDQINELVNTIGELKKRLLVDNEGELVQLAFLAAKKIALRDLNQNPEAVIEILRTVLGEIQGQEQVIVRLAPMDAEFIETMQQKADRKLELLEKVKLTVDERVSPGGCFIETEYGSVDATIEERVERVWQTLLSRVPQNKPMGET